jgi:hypothetical protein
MPEFLEKEVKLVQVLVWIIVTALGGLAGGSVLTGKTDMQLRSDLEARNIARIDAMDQRIYGLERSIVRIEVQFENIGSSLKRIEASQARKEGK